MQSNHRNKRTGANKRMGGLVGSVGALLAAMLALALFGAAPALAGPLWRIDAFADSPVAPGGSVSFWTRTADIGDADASGVVEPIVVSVTLPAGLTAQSAQVLTAEEGLIDASARGWTCDDGNGGPLVGAHTIRCTSPTNVIPDYTDGSTHYYLAPPLVFLARVGPHAAGVMTSAFAVSGAGAPRGASTAWPVTVSGAPAAFGLAAFDALVSDGSGEPFTQAGGHPEAVTTSFDITTRDARAETKNDLVPVEAVKDVLADLPEGLVGNPGALAQCTAEQLANGFGQDALSLCPVESQVGDIVLHVNEGTPQPLLLPPVPIYNMVPPRGVPAEFGFNVLGTVTSLAARLRVDPAPGGGFTYGLSVDSKGITEVTAVRGATVTFWGNPASPSHDLLRACPGVEQPFGLVSGTNTCKSGAQAAAFMRTPTSCTPEGSGMAWALHADSWPHQGGLDQNGAPDLSDPAWQTATLLSHELPGYPDAPSEWGAPVGVSGCAQVPFSPSIQVTPSTSAPATPSGLDVALSVPQGALSEPGALAQADLRKVVVRLPEGVSVNPSSADGLGACSPAQIGLGSITDPSCPENSKIGTVEIKTPLLSDPIEGSVYLASQNENPFGSLLAVYMVAKGPGFAVKFPVRVDTDALTGRLTATLEGLPQLPISTVSVSLKTGSRAPFVTPSVCGSSAVETMLEGWNGKTVTVQNPYTVDCTPGLGGFSPSFAAGTTNPQAGGFSPLTVSLGRQDGEQDLSGLTMKTPPGLLGVLKSVVQCPEPQAGQGTCGDASLIGNGTAGAGAGSDPISVAGKVFLTGPYEGAPFGLSIVVPAVAGPFNLGTVVVRARIEVDPHTAQITVISDPLPTILQGIPLQVRTVDVTVDRPGFLFNPTSCAPLGVDGTVSSTQGAQASVSSPFQAVNCATLGFHPSFKVSTKAATSKKAGAFLDVKVTSGAGQANLGKVAVSLPKQLPSRLTTIQQACPAGVFDANPASCPAGSNIGIGTASTPILANPVTGPVYLVSHGGAAFPDIVMVLQGEGVTLQVTGSINIKKGVTSSAFNSIPDAPISTFELRLPQDAHSALGANLPAKAKGNLCGQTLTMPTTLTGQNNAQVKQSTKIAVAGCPKAKAKKKHTQGAHGKAKQQGKGKKRGK